MTRRWVLLAVPLLLAASLAWALPTAGPAVDWEVLGSGGAPALGGAGSVHLNGTLGQTAIGSSAGTGVALGAGFWYGLGGVSYHVYLPLIARP